MSMAAPLLTSFTQSPLRQVAPKPSVNKLSSVPFRKPSLVASATATDQTTRLRFAAEMSVPSSSFYDVLGIPMTASCHEIKAAYRKLVRTCHPDVVAINQKESSANQFIKIQAAYSTLSDPDKRANYDREIYRAQMHLNLSSRRSVTMASVTSPVSGYSGYYARRNWESDQCW